MIRVPANAFSCVWSLVPVLVELAPGETVEATVWRWLLASERDTVRGVQIQGKYTFDSMCNGQS